MSYLWFWVGFLAVLAILYVGTSLRLAAARRPPVMPTMPGTVVRCGDVEYVIVDLGRQMDGYGRTVSISLQDRASYEHMTIRPGG